MKQICKQWWKEAQSQQINLPMTADQWVVIFIGMHAPKFITKFTFWPGKRLKNFPKI
jgi:hypothetical protein